MISKELLKHIIVSNQEDVENYDSFGTIEVMPLWKWMLCSGTSNA